MRFLFLTALLLLFRLSLIAQTKQYCFSKPDIYSGVSHNQVNAILKDAEGFVWFITMPGLAVMMDIDVNFFTSNYDDSSPSWSELEFCRDGFKLFPKLKLIQCVS